uniref:Uncharacterized protein n=1 Tax=Vitis vinifera TaxID=29760 RepID=F6HM75_VITVI
MDNIEIHLVRQTRGGKEEGEEHRSTKVLSGDQEGSITTGHARKLLPMTFLYCHAFGEVVFGGKSPEEIFMLREHAHHTGKENNCSSKDF